MITHLDPDILQCEVKWALESITAKKASGCDGIPVELFQILKDGVQAGFRKGRGTRGQIANIRWIIKKVNKFQKNIYFCFTDYAKCLTVWITTNRGKFFKTWEDRSDHLTCLLRNLYAVRKQQSELDMEQQTGSK